MIRNKPPAIARQLDRCDVCGDKMHRDQLVRTQVEFLDMKAENWFSYSSYDGTYWVVDTAADTSTVSYGNRCDNARTTLDSDNDISYINGVQTWTGDGVLRSTVENGPNTPTYNITFSAVFGPHEQNTSPESTVVVGITNNDGSVLQPIKTFTTSGITRVWFNEEVATLEGYGLGDTSYYFFFYVSVTNDGAWWIDEMQVESNVDSMPLQPGHPENFVRTSGASVSNQTERSLMTQRKVCTGCRELILSKSERFGKTDESPTDEPVETWAQEI